MATFPKHERLCGKIRIQQLYQTGKKFVVWPLRVTYSLSEEVTGESPQVLIWAPKSMFHHAVDRNRLRRQMREAWRLQKDSLPATSRVHYIAFNYIDHEMQPYEHIARAVKKAITKLS